MPAKRTGRAIRLNRSLAPILPADWVRWNEIVLCDSLEIGHNREARIRPARRPTDHHPGRGSSVTDRTALYARVSTEDQSVETQPGSRQDRRASKCGPKWNEVAGHTGIPAETC